MQPDIANAHFLMGNLIFSHFTFGGMNLRSCQSVSSAIQNLSQRHFHLSLIAAVATASALGFHARSFTTSATRKPQLRLFLKTESFEQTFTCPVAMKAGFDRYATLHARAYGEDADVMILTRFIEKRIA